MGPAWLGSMSPCFGRAETCGRHWGCHGPLVIDARVKPFHAPMLVDDPAVVRRVDELGAKSGPLEGII